MLVPEPLTYLAVPLLFRDKLGVPLTVTASLKLTDSRTVPPVPTTPVPLRMPDPVAEIHWIFGAFGSTNDLVSTTSVPAGCCGAPAMLTALPA